MGYKKVSRVVCAVIFVAICGAAIRAEDDKKADDDKKPTFALTNLAFKGFDLSNRTAEVIAFIEVKNPGSAFKVTDVNYKLRLNDKAVAEGKYEKELDIPAADKITLELPFTVDITSILGVAWNTITDSLTLHYELETQFSVPIFAALKITQKSTFKGELPLGEAFTSLSNRLKERLFGKP